MFLKSEKKIGNGESIAKIIFSLIKSNKIANL